MTLYGYARVSVREPEDKNLDLQVERLVRSGCVIDSACWASGELALSAVVRNCTENSAERCPGSDETADRAAVKPCEADQLVRAGGELAIYGRQPWVNVPSLLPTHGRARSEGKHEVFSCVGAGLPGSSPVSRCRPAG